MLNRSRRKERRSLTTVLIRLAVSAFVMLAVWVSAPQIIEFLREAFDKEFAYQDIKLNQSITQSQREEVGK